MILSGVAIFVSACVALYTFVKDRKARKQSISDDYWLRKVIGPIAVEPLLSDLLELSAKIPVDCCDPDFNVRKTEKFSRDYSASHVSSASKLMALAVLDEQLYRNAIDCLDAIEEAVVSYCGLNVHAFNTKPSGGTAMTREQLRSQILVCLKRLLDNIRGYQTSLK
jgi:hypothetical protein